jgi:hypothetical protein
MRGLIRLLIDIHAELPPLRAEVSANGSSDLGLEEGNRICASIAAGDAIAYRRTE